MENDKEWFSVSGSWYVNLPEYYILQIKSNPENFVIYTDPNYEIATIDKQFEEMEDKTSIATDMLKDIGIST